MTISTIVLCLFGNDTARTHSRPPAVSEPDTQEVRSFAVRRQCFSSMEVSFPALALRNHAVARWVRNHDVAVTVGTSDDLGAAISAGIHPSRLTVHANGVLPNELVFCAANLAVGRVVVNTLEHVKVLTHAIGPRRRQAVLFHVADKPADSALDAVVAAVLASPRLHLAGFHADIGLTASDFVSFPAAIGELICTMRRVQKEQGRVLTRLSLGGMPDLAGDQVVDLARHAEVIDQSLDDACLTVTFPRPTVTVSATSATGGRAA